MNDQANSPKKMHYAWWILVSCCFMFAGSMALINSIIGVYMLPVTTALGCARGDFTLLLTCQALTIVVSLPIWGNVMQNKKISINVSMTIGALCMILGVLGFSFSRALWQFYIFGALTGIGIAPCFTMATPLLIGNWFTKKHRGKMIGIASAFAGVSIIFWSPLFTIIIHNLGWSTAYLINAALMAVLLLPFTLFVIKRNPEDKGLKPFGYVEGEVEAVADDNNVGITAKSVFKMPAFWILFLGVTLTAMGMGFNNNQTGIAKEFLAGSSMEASAIALVGASMISAAAVGNLISKLAFGFLADRVKLNITFVIFLVVWLLAFVIWYFFGTATGALIAGGFCLGFL